MNNFFVISLKKGFALGSTVCVFAYVLDRTMSNGSYNSANKENPSLYKSGWTKIITNLTIINPPIYSIVDNFFINKLDFLIHRELHINSKLYKIHSFHHRFDKLILPSTGFAVSHSEFLIAYASPLVIASILIHPSEASFLSAISLISLFNLFIHCQELRTMKWIPGFVSPDMHITHHEVRLKHYAAPFFNFDELILDNFSLKHSNT
jgi:sterol desaturase/sphingolipid hydroxylase (fatty acid hydroxylase superfamily)